MQLDVEAHGQANELFVLSTNLPKENVVYICYVVLCHSYTRDADE